MNSILGSVVPLAMFIIKDGPLRVSFQSTLSGFLSAQKSAQRKKRSTKKALKQVLKKFSKKKLLYDRGSPSPGRFFLLNLGPEAAVGGMRIEINTGYKGRVFVTYKCKTKRVTR